MRPDAILNVVISLILRTSFFTSMMRNEKRTPPFGAAGGPPILLWRSQQGILLVQDWLGLGDVSLPALWALFFAYGFTAIQVCTL